MDGTFRLRGRYDDHYTNIFQGCSKEIASVVVSMVYLLVYHNWEYWEEINQLLQLLLYFFVFFALFIVPYSFRWTFEFCTGKMYPVMFTVFIIKTNHFVILSIHLLTVTINWCINNCRFYCICIIVF